MEDLVGGRYRLERVLGRGAFGSVLRARDERLGRAVALKRIPASQAHPGARARFEREAGLTAKLRHPHVVRVYDHGQEADGTLFIAYELVEGPDLAARLADPAPLSPDQALAWATALADALAAVHRAGLIHRDVKPGNVLLRDGEVPVLADFGLALDLDRATRLTESGVLVGTPAYMPPECYAGDPGSAAGDQFAWGAVVYELLYRRRIRDHETMMALMAGAVEAGALPPMGTHPALDPVLARAMARDPASRYPDLDAAREALVAASAGTRSGAETRPIRGHPGSGPAGPAGPSGPSGASVPSGAPGPARPPARVPSSATLALAGLVLAAAGLALATRQVRPAPPGPDPVPAATADPGDPFPTGRRLLPGHEAEHGDLLGALDTEHARRTAGTLVDPRLPLQLRRLLDELEAAWGTVPAPPPPTALALLPVHLLEDLLALEHGLTVRTSRGQATPADAALLGRAVEQLRALRVEAQALVDRLLARPDPAPDGLLFLAAGLSARAPSPRSLRLLRILHQRILVLSPAPPAALVPLLQARVALTSLSDTGALPCPDRLELAQGLLGAARERPAAERLRILAGLGPEVAQAAVLCVPGPGEALLQGLDTVLDAWPAALREDEAWARDCAARALAALDAERGLEARRGTTLPGLAARAGRLRAFARPPTGP